MINSHFLFIYILISVALFFMFLIYWSGKQVPSNLEKWEKLPRNIFFGMILAVVDLAICIPHSQPLVPVWMQSWLIPTAIIFAWLIYKFLDYIFARAFGGLLILLAHYLLFASFNFKIPAQPLFSILCFAMGTLGIFFCGKPYLMRDLIRKIASNLYLQFSAATVSAVYALVFLLTGIFQFIKTR